MPIDILGARAITIYKANKKKLCHRITPKIEGFKRPNWAQTEAELCVSDLGGLFFGFDFQVAQNDVYIYLYLIIIIISRKIT